MAEVSIANAVRVQGVWGWAVWKLPPQHETSWCSRWPGRVFVPADVPCRNLVILGVRFLPGPSWCRVVFAVLPARTAQSACCHHWVCPLEVKLRYSNVGLFGVVSFVLLYSQLLLVDGSCCCYILFAYHQSKLPNCFCLFPSCSDHPLARWKWNCNTMLSFPWLYPLCWGQPCWPCRVCIFCAVAIKVATLLMTPVVVISYQSKLPPCCWFLTSSMLTISCLYSVCCGSQSCCLVDDVLAFLLPARPTELARLE